MLLFQRSSCIKAEEIERQVSILGLVNSHGERRVDAKV